MESINVYSVIIHYKCQFIWLASCDLRSQSDENILYTATKKSGHLNNNCIAHKNVLALMNFSLMFYILIKTIVIVVLSQLCPICFILHNLCYSSVNYFALPIMSFYLNILNKSRSFQKITNLFCVSILKDVIITLCKLKLLTIFVALIIKLSKVMECRF